MPIGVGPYGFGTSVPTVLVVEAPLGSSREIGTGQENRGQVVFENGNAVSSSDARQLVIMALTTELGSSAVEDLGRDIEPPDFGGNFVQRKRAQIQSALADLVKANIVRIDSIEVVEQFGGRSFTRVALYDLTQSQPFVVKS